jgi:hypothetical protein
LSYPERKQARSEIKEKVLRKRKYFYILKIFYSIMALKVKAVERLVRFNKNDAGKYLYVMQPELYIPLAQQKVIKEAALRSGVSQGVMQACWDAAGEVIKAWATEGHSVALPGLGTMRFGLRSKAVEDVNDVKSGLIRSRRDVNRSAKAAKQNMQIIILRRLNTMFDDMAASSTPRSRAIYDVDGTKMVFAEMTMMAATTITVQLR